MDIDTHGAGMLALQLDSFRKHVDELAGQWDGDNPGNLEDLAHVCNDISSACVALQELLAELDNV